MNDPTYRDHACRMASTLVALGDRLGGNPAAQYVVAQAANTITRLVDQADAAQAAQPVPPRPIVFRGEPAPPIIYLCGDYLTNTSENPLRLLSNIRSGLDLANVVAEAGAAAYAPWWDADLAAHRPDMPPSQFMLRSLAFLGAASALVAISDWRKSEYQTFEVTTARDRGIPVYEINFRKVYWADELRDFVEGVCDSYWEAAGYGFHAGTSAGRDTL